jgi:hypothetical protein
MPGVSLRKLVVTLLASVVLGVPFVLVARAASALIAPLTAGAVTTLLRIAAPLSAANSPASDSEASDAAVEESPELVFQVATKPPARTAKAPLRAKPAALFVSEATVLRLAQSAARPRGSFVAQTPQHPAGLRLSGVAALGIGVQDGDILIEALGIAPHAPGEIIGAILEARAKQARFLSGTLWRQGQTFRITVEQPYLAQPA